MSMEQRGESREILYTICCDGAKLPGGGVLLGAQGCGRGAFFPLCLADFWTAVLYTCSLFVCLSNNRV